MKRFYARISIMIAMMLMGYYYASAQEQANSTVPHPTLHVVLLGDSNTWIGGDDCDKERGWNTWFKQLFKPASCKSYARSGATWTNTKVTKRNPKENIGNLGNDNVIYNQVVRLIAAAKAGQQEKPDLVVIAAGTNDVWFKAKRPGIYTMTPQQAASIPVAKLTAKPVSQVLSLAEAVRYNCELIRQAFPNTTLIVLTPLQTTKVSVEEIRKAGDIIQATAEQTGVRAIRQDTPDFIDRATELKQFTHTYDGVHTSKAGAQNNAAILNRKISQIL